MTSYTPEPPPVSEPPRLLGQVPGRVRRFGYTKRTEQPYVIPAILHNVLYYNISLYNHFNLRLTLA